MRFNVLPVWVLVVCMFFFKSILKYLLNKGINSLEQWEVGKVVFSSIQYQISLNTYLYIGLVFLKTVLRQMITGELC